MGRRAATRREVVLLGRGILIVRTHIRAALAGAVLATTLTVAAAAAGSTTAQKRIAAPDPSRLGAIGPRFHDAVLSGPVRTLASAGARFSDFWGGPITAANGETLTIYVSNVYAQDDTMRQNWADFLVRLYHGSELDDVTIILAPLTQIQTICGPEAGGCFAPSAGALVAPAEDLPDGTSKETVVVHELGHNVAAHRDDAPWDALDWGAKHWASYENVCARQVAGTAFPGDEADHYFLNPGEGFAETYRLLNFQLLGLTSSIFVVDQSFFPDQGALDALKADVLTPWIAGATSTWASRFVVPAPRKPPAIKRPVKKRTAKPKPRSANAYTPPALLDTIQTPLDGTLTVTLTKAPAGTRLGLEDATGTQLVAPTAGPLTFTVCGQRTVTLVATGTAGGPVSVSIDEP